MTPVAVLRTRRVVYRLTDPRGAELVEVADDAVTAQRFEADGSVTVRSWREWEVELLGDPPAVLMTAIDTAFREAGAGPATYPSKLARALDRPAPAPSPNPQPGTPRSRTSVVLQAHLTDLVTELQARDSAARTGEPAAIHRMRVATRRLRSALAGFDDCFDTDRTAPIGVDLHRLAGSLGGVRDLQVLRERLDHALDDENTDPAQVEATRTFVTVTLLAREEHALRMLQADLDASWYFRLLDALDGLAVAAPFSERAQRRARKVLPADVARVWKKLRRRAEFAVATAADHPDHHAADHPLHAARKAAKKVRYAGEAVSAVFPGAADLADAVKNLQENLGDHQDSVVARAALTELADAARGAGVDTFVLGRLHARQEAGAAVLEAAFPQVWRRTARPSLRRWLRD